MYILGDKFVDVSRATTSAEFLFGTTLGRFEISRIMTSSLGLSLSSLSQLVAEESSLEKMPASCFGEIWPTHRGKLLLKVIQGEIFVILKCFNNGPIDTLNTQL